jgi:probable rRNA maturation factor
MILNQQHRYPLRLSVLNAYVRDLKRRLKLGRCDWNICFMDDDGIRRFNAAFRGKDYATDVLSFRWDETPRPRRAARGAKPQRRVSPRAQKSSRAEAELAGFLGDIVISVEAARRNAQDEGHSTLNEIRWLILHGVLHLLGYDHEHDNGEMTGFELALREQMTLAHRRRRRTN